MTSRPRIAADAPPVLQALALTVGYRIGRARCELLRRVNLAVRAGELMCVLGPNGVGKSTLLRTLVGLQPALDGEVMVSGAARYEYFSSGMSSATWIVFLRTVRKPSAISLAP